MNIFQQYNRRENIELSAVPENILQKDLERVVIGILRHIGVHNLSLYEIVACHRLMGYASKGSASVGLFKRNFKFSIALLPRTLDIPNNKFNKIILQRVKILSPFDNMPQHQNEQEPTSRSNIYDV